MCNVGGHYLPQRYRQSKYAKNSLFDEELIDANGVYWMSAQFIIEMQTRKSVQWSCNPVKDEEGWVGYKDSIVQ